MPAHPDQCVASAQQELDVGMTVKINGRQQATITGRDTAGIMARFLGLKWRTVQKRRQRGEDWRDSLNPKLKRSPRPRF